MSTTQTFYAPQLETVNGESVEVNEMYKLMPRTDDVLGQFTSEVALLVAGSVR